MAKMNLECLFRVNPERSRQIFTDPPRSEYSTHIPTQRTCKWLNKVTNERTH